MTAVMRYVAAAAALLLPLAAAQTIPSGCYLLPPSQQSVFNSDSMVPEMCTQKCGPSQLALIAPTLESIWNFHCACASATPASRASIPCSVKCPGAPIPSQAPPCGGSFNGQISWSAYGNLPPALVVAPDPVVVENPQPSAKSEDPSSPPAVTSAQPASVIESQQPVSTSSSSSSVSVQPLKPSSAFPSTTFSASESSISAAARNGSVPIAPPSYQGDGGITSEKNAGLNSVGLIAGGFVAGVVVLAVGFTVIAQRRRKQRPYKQNTAQEPYGDSNRLIQQEQQQHRSGGFDSCDDTESMSSVSLPPLAAQLNMSYLKDDSPPVLLYGFGSRATTLNTVNSPEISFGSPTRTAALGAMPDKLKYSLGTKDSSQTSSTSSIGTPATCLVSGPGGVGGGSVLYPSYYSGGSSYSPLLKLNRGSVGGSSVAASSLFMRGLAKNMKSDEESARGMRQDVLYTQRRG
ncbi:hypothetical protein CcCBS67573_g02362 [Chytriomyces confervae]|uniref:WSC domain-containing protein n=1 Tax=Chytriomyces confervae TaxID=246404 RepID=A0A507FJ76_9FUNG|nr:hypothetical protein CcCBS67573_g02362 [Chytriomyces confervae]